jgi:hypothetical protein
MDLMNNGHVIIAGYTSSSTLYTVDGFGATASAGNQTAFIMEIDPSQTGFTGTTLTDVNNFRNSSVPFSTMWGASTASLQTVRRTGQHINDIDVVNIGGTEFVLVAGIAMTTFQVPASYNTHLNSLQSNPDGFAAKLDLSAAGTAQIKFFTYIGGSSLDAAYGLANVPNTNTLYVTGASKTGGLSTSGAFKTSAQGLNNTKGLAYIAKYDMSLATSALQAFTYFGNGGTGTSTTYGQATIGQDIQIYPTSNSVIMSGTTCSTCGLNTTTPDETINGYTLYGSGGAQGLGSGSGGADTYIAIFNPALSTLELGAYVAGTSDDYPYEFNSLAVTANGMIMGNTTHSTNYVGTSTFISNNPTEPGINVTTPSTTTNDNPVMTRWNFFAILPVDLLSFEGKAEDKQTYLEWKTATEVNSKEFVVEI